MAGLVLELSTEVVDRKGVGLLGRRVELPLTGRILRHVARGGEPVATVPHLRRGVRRADHELAGPQGEGWQLHQRRWTRFELLDPSGAPRARIREKVGRLSRGLRQSWDLEVDGAPTLVLRNRAALNPLTKLRKELRRDQLSTFDTKDGTVRLHLWASVAVLEADPVPPSLADPVVAATLLACVHDLYDHDAT